MTITIMGAVGLLGFCLFWIAFASVSWSDRRHDARMVAASERALAADVAAAVVAPPPPSRRVPVPARHLPLVPSGVGTRTGPMIERAGDVPILGFKAAQLIWNVGEHFGPTLHSVYGFDWDASTTDAICARGRVHEQIPAENCTCGWYARRRAEDVERMYHVGSVMVEVELSGRVIVHEHGYRAQHQRLLAVGVAPCWYCAEEPTLVATKLPSPFDSPVNATVLIPLCDTHERFVHADVRMGLDELGTRLGAPIGVSEFAPTNLTHQAGS